MRVALVELVEVVEHDDRLGQVLRAGAEGLEQRGAQSAAVHGDQGGEVGQVGARPRPSLQEPLGEPDRIVVGRARGPTTRNQVGRVAAHWASSTDLPAPAGATMR